MQFTKSPIPLLGLLLLASCTKVIDVKLNDSNAQYVIDAAITDAPGPYTVHITRSVNFSDANDYPGVPDATIVISDAAGNTDTLSQTSPGIYHTHTLQGVPGLTYTMRIVADGRTFTAVSTMPSPIHFDSLYTEVLSRFGNASITPVVVYRDPAGIENYYNFVVYRNGARIKRLYAESDFAGDGRHTFRTIRDEDTTYKSGDRVQIDMQSVDKPVYTYYNSLEETISQNSASPSNPVTNITGGNALGCFSAHTTQVKTVVVP